MDIVLKNPAVSLWEETLNVLVAPPKMLIQAINTSQRILQYKTLFIGGSFSQILGRLHHPVTARDVRRAFISFSALDHSRGDPPLVPDREARSHPLRGFEGDDRVRGPAHAPDVQGGHRPALLAFNGSATFREWLSWPILSSASSRCREHRRRPGAGWI